MPDIEASVTRLIAAPPAPGWLAPGFLRRLYQAELALLAERAGS